MINKTLYAIHSAILKLFELDPQADSGSSHVPVYVKDIWYYRNRIFNLFTIYLIPIGLIALIPGIFMAINNGTMLGYTIAGFDVITAALLSYIILSKSISTKFKKLFLITTLYILAIFLLVTLGSFGPGILYLFLLTVLMSLIYDSRIGLLSIWLNFMICVFLGFVIELKLFNSKLLAEYSLGGWIAYASNLIFLSIISFILINRLIIGLENKIKQLSKSEARQTALFASQTNYMIRTDLTGRYTYVNDKYASDFGWLYHGKEIIGQQALGSVLEYHHQRLQETVERCISGEVKVAQIELDKPGQDGDIITTLWDFICLVQQDGKSIEIQCIGIDISQRIKAEQELELSVEDLYKHNKELQTFAYVISHNLRAPIANMNGLVELMTIDKDDPAATDDYLTQLKKSVDSLEQVTQDLSQAVSIQAHSAELAIEELDLIEILQSVKSDLSSLLSSTFTVLDLPQGPYRLHAHKAYLYSIFSNLIYNAIKYKSENAPIIAISITTSPQYISISVADNGMGINLDKHLNDIFKPYRRLDNSVPGKGLGLFIVKRHVEALKGIVLVESQVNVGTTFTIVLPYT